MTHGRTVSTVPTGGESGPPVPLSAPFDAVFDAHYRDLMRFAVVFTGDRPGAEDVVADVFARLLTGRRRVDVRDPGAYLRRCVVNEVRSRWRRQERRRRLAPAAPRPPANGEGFAGRVDERDRVLGAVAQLPPRQRAVVVLRFYEDRSETETAELLGMATGTVKSTLAQARRRLQALLEGHDGG